MKAYLLNHWQFAVTLLVVVAVLVLGGCASLQSKPDPVRIAVTLGVAKLIENSSDPAARAARIRDVAGKLVAALEGNPETTVELLRAEALRHIPSSFSPVDRAAALELVNFVAGELTARVGSGAIPRDKVVAVRSVLQWVIDGATFASPAAGTE